MLRCLRVLDFRCFASLDLEMPPGGGLFTGANAQGKTSVLEAVCLLVRLHSPRTHRMATVAKIDGHGGFGIAGDAWGCERRIDWQRRTPMSHQVNGVVRASQGRYLEDGGLVVWMGNEDLELVRGGGESRRRYLDFISSQVEPEYRRALHRYRRAVKAKNMLLKDDRARRDEIASYESVMVAMASVIRKTRVDLMRPLSRFVSECQREIAGSGEELECILEISGGDDFEMAIDQAREREMKQRRSLVGPHRDELRFMINGMAAGDFASEGQQRTLALALKLGQGRLLSERCDKTPLWLIDDVFGELDVMRRHALLRALPVDAQKWITTTQLQWLDESEGLYDLPRFEVTGGHVKEASK